MPGLKLLYITTGATTCRHPHGTLATPVLKALYYVRHLEFQCLDAEAGDIRNDKRRRFWPTPPAVRRPWR